MACLYPYHWVKHLDHVAETLSKELSLPVAVVRAWPEEHIIKMSNNIALLNAKTWERARQVKANRLGVDI